MKKLRTYDLTPTPVHLEIVEVESSEGTTFELRTLHGRRMAHLTHFAKPKASKLVKAQTNDEARVQERAEKYAREVESPYLYEWQELKLRDARADMDAFAVYYCINKSSEVHLSHDKEGPIYISDGIFLPPPRLQTCEFFRRLATALEHPRLMEPWRQWLLANWFTRGFHRKRYKDIADELNKQFPFEKASEAAWKKVINRMGIFLDKPPGPPPRAAS